MFQNQDFAAHQQQLKERKGIFLIGNATGGIMLISNALTYIVNVFTLLFLMLIGKEDILNDAGVLLILQIIFSVLVFTIPALLLPLLTQDKLSEVFLAKRVPIDTCVPLVLIGFGVVALSNIGNSIFASIFSLIGITPAGYDVDLPSGFFGVILTFLSGAFFPALVEEFAMRGVVLGVVKKHYGNGTAIIISSILFSLMHGNLEQIPFTFLLGLYLGYITVYTGSVFPAVILHFANNFFSFALELLTKNLGPTANTVITLLYFAIMLCVGLGGVILFTKSHSILKISIDKTKKFTLALCKTPCMIIYFIAATVEVILAQLGIA